MPTQWLAVFFTNGSCVSRKFTQLKTYLDSLAPKVDHVIGFWPMRHKLKVLADFPVHAQILQSTPLLLFLSSLWIQ